MIHDPLVLVSRLVGIAQLKPTGTQDEWITCTRLPPDLLLTGTLTASKKIQRTICRQDSVGAHEAHYDDGFAGAD